MLKIGRIISLATTLAFMKVRAFKKDVLDLFKENVTKPIRQRYKAYFKRPLQKFYRSKIKTPYKKYIKPKLQTLGNGLKTAGYFAGKVLKPVGLVIAAPFYGVYLAAKHGLYRPSKFLLSLAYQPIDNKFDKAIDGLEQIERNQFDKIEPKLKEKLRKEFKTEWKRSIASKKDLDVKKRAAEAEKKASEGDDYKSTYTPYEEPQFDEGQFDWLFNQAVNFSFVQMEEGHHGDARGNASKKERNKLTIHIDKHFERACNEDGSYVAQTLHRVAANFLKESGYSPKDFNPILSTETVELLPEKVFSEFPFYQKELEKVASQPAKPSA